MAFLFLPGAGLAASFDCQGTRTAVERQICGDRVLSRQDDRLARAFRDSRSAFGSAGEAAEDLDRAQAAWIAGRDKCGGLPCLRRAYAGQLAVLGFRGRPGSHAPADAWAGRYGHGGFIELKLQVRDDHSVRVAIHGADPSAGRWTCTYAGIAQITGAAAQATGGLTLQRQPGAVEVPDTPANQAVSTTSCGVNGTLAWRYRALAR